jgi:hypothetical protein
MGLEMEKGVAMGGLEGCAEEKGAGTEEKVAEGRTPSAGSGV